MKRQITLSSLSDELAQAKTKKKEFLTQIDSIIPWGEWMEIIRPHYYKGERGNKPYELELMLRLYLTCCRIYMIWRTEQRQSKSSTAAPFRNFAA